MRGVQYKDVEAAIATLQAEGKTPTNDNILAKLGTGSKSTIHRHFRTWQEAQPKPQAQERKVPDSIFKAILREIDEVEAKAVAHLRTELAEIQHNADELAASGEQAEEKISELESALSASHETVTRLNAQLDEKAANLEALRSENRDLLATVDRLRTELAKSELRLEGFVELKVEHKATLEKLQAALIEAAELRGTKGSVKK